MDQDYTSFIITGILIVLIALFTFLFHVRFDETSRNKGPTFLTTIGIFGTFLGVAIGLLNFEPTDQGINYLISGIKIAFWASAIGILGALTIKFREIFFKRKINNDNQYDGATINDLAALLDDIKGGLVGSDETTLIGQIKLTRQESNDKFTLLKQSLDQFCSKVADNNSKALIDALQEVIRDFNTKINDQFGDNFKQLNEAVSKILDWQEQYRIQLTELIEQQSVTTNNMNLSVESMSIATDRYSKFMQESRVFNDITSNLSTVLSTLSGSITAIETQRSQIQESLKSLSTLVNTASDGLPKIEENVTNLTKQLSQAVIDTSDKFSKKLLEGIDASTQRMGQDISSLTSNLSQIMKNANDEFKGVLVKGIQDANNEVNQNLQRIHSEVNANLSNIIERTKEQVVVLDKALSAQLDKSLVSMGNQLASLSRKFVEDYEPLTRRLAQILEIAKVN